MALVVALAVAPATLQAQVGKDGDKIKPANQQPAAPSSGADRATVEANAAAQVQAKSPKARIEAAVQAAVRANVPASLLESKIAEGEAKHVPEERIATAVEARARALIDASHTMSNANIEAQSAGELAIAADALQAGVSKNVLIKTYRSAPAERRIVAVAVVADLVRLGTQSDQAFARVNKVLGSSVALANLQAEVASQLRLGGLSSTLDASGILRLK
jgi:hypothetical protein